MKPIFSADIHWIRARRELLEQVKGEVLRRLGLEPSELRAYSREYEKELQRRWRASNKAELLLAIEGAEIVYGGDFHAFGQSQRTHLKVLRSLVLKRPVFLALECVSIKYQKWLDWYLQGKISIDDLRRRTRWAEEWGFPWENYRPLFELAKDKGFRLLALNAPKNLIKGTELVERDQIAAQMIRDVYVRHPGALIYVIFGDLHLATKHLPLAVRKCVPSTAQVRDLILHLNSERIYFQLARKGLELSVDVVRLTRNQFCIMSSPPWLQWQSYLLYLEKTADEGLDAADEEGEFDYTDQVVHIVNLVSKDLNLQLKVDDLSIYSAEDNRIWRHFEKTLRTKEQGIAHKMVAAGRSFFIPHGGVGYLSRSTVNHAASLAGQYIHARLSGRKRMLWDMPKDFPALIWTEAVSYFMSKLINHKRQSQTVIDLQVQLAASGTAAQAREALRLALDQSMSELIFVRQGRRRAPSVRPRQTSSYLEAARILGGMMGERLCLAYRSRKISNREILQLLKKNVAAKNFKSEYENIVRLLSELLSSGERADAFEEIKSRKERL